MVSFQKSVGDKVPYLHSFDDTCKTAYSHGLENIYALENVDIKSIRTFTVSEEIHSEPILKAYKSPKPIYQLDFNFGYPFFLHVAPFFPDEPIQSLGLSRLAEKCLLSHQKIYIRDLINQDLSRLALGHLDEIRTKLADFTAGRDLMHADTIDFASWVRIITSTGDRRKWHLLLDRYGLSELVPLSSSETADLKKLTATQRIEWERQAVELIDKNKVDSTWKKLAARFVLPWMRGRSGIASRAEINERLRRVSHEHHAAEQVLLFMESALYRDRSVLGNMIFPLEKDLYAVDLQTQEEYLRIAKHAVSYFYKSDARFPIGQLIRWIERDYAREWVSFPTGFIEKVIRSTPELLVRKDAHNSLIVRLS